MPVEAGNTTLHTMVLARCSGDLRFLAMKNALKSISAVSLLLFGCCFSPLPAATWTNKDGRKIEADYVALDGEYVRLRLTGKRSGEVRVKISDLSEKDQKYLKWRKGHDETLKEGYHGPPIEIMRGETKAVVPLLKDDRLHLGSKESYVQISVKNTEKQRPNRPWSNITQSAMVAIAAESRGTAEEILKKEKEQRSRNHDVSEVLKLDDKSMMMILSSLDDRKRVTSKRCYLYQTVGKETLILDATYHDYRSVSKPEEGRQFVVDLLTGLRVNGAAVPEVQFFLEVLATAEHEEVVSKRKIRKSP